MMTSGSHSISENSRRIAKNTLLLYFRMLLLMFISLFTSRLVLRSLGEVDFGVYGVVEGLVMLFTFVSTSISSAISRYLAHAIGQGDGDRLRRAFSTGVIILAAMALLIALVTETAGMWYLNHKMVLPADRIGAARVVLHCVLGVLVLNLFSLPYNAVIISHEKMSAFAAISIFEAVLKIAVALLLYVSAFDKLETYAVLMLVVALLVRGTYSLYCRRHFEESRGRIVFDAALLREMWGFTGWSIIGSSAYVINARGLNLVINAFFGVTLNAARALAVKVEDIVKQFVSSFLTAVNPQITKSWAAGNREYCYELVRKGARFSYLAILFFAVPFFVETQGILNVWLGADVVPSYAADFVRLTLISLIIDMTGNTLLTLILATGHIKKYYIISGTVSFLALPMVWLFFRLGFSPAWAYVAFIAMYLAVWAIRLVTVSRHTDFPVRAYLKDMGMLVTFTFASVNFPILISLLFAPGLLRFIGMCLVSWLVMAAFTYIYILTPGEKAFIFRKTGRFLPDRMFLKIKYKEVYGRKLNLRSPAAFSEKVQWCKLYDRNPLYHRLVDKADVKGYVAGIIGEEHVVPTLGLWNRVEDIDWNSLPERFVIKCTHDSGSTIVCHDKASFDRGAAEQKLAASLAKEFYSRDREWAYKGLKPRVIAEQYLGADVNDYKFFCFDGEPKLLYVASMRGSATEETRFDFFDMDYRHLDIRNGHPNSEVPPACPEHFEQMKTLARALSKGIPQVRVDFYEVDGVVYFGEFTFYHMGGFVPFDPDGADEFIGQLWKM